MKRLLCVWLPNWPIQRLRIEEPAGAGPEGAIVLWKEDSRRGRLVVACCRRARALGVRPGMPIAHAGEIVQCDGTEARIEQQDLQLDNQSLQKIAGLLQQQITPLVAIEALDDKPWAGHPRHQSESLLCDISGAEHLFGGEKGLLQAADELLQKAGLQSRMAIADSVGAAWALAHHGDQETPIESLPVESLRITTEVAGTLSRLGVERVDQLLQLPRSGLAARLGCDLVRRIEQVLGQSDEPLGVYRPPAEHTAELSLEYPTSDQKILADRIERLIKKVRAGLATCQRGALRMACRLDLAAHPPLTFEIGLFAPTVDVDHLSGLMINRLETKKLPSCVHRLTVSVTLSGPLRSAQASLFGHEPCENASNLRFSGSTISRLVDSLSGRLGRDAVLSVRIEDDPLPEKAYSLSPLAGNRISSGSANIVRPRRTAKSSSHFNASFQPSGREASSDDSVVSADFSFQPSPDDAMRRPLFLLAEPVPLAVALQASGPFNRCASSPRLPRWIRLDGMIHQVVRHWGPERIETGWWKGPSIRRDYYRVETDRGRWWWIFRNLTSKTQASDASSRYRWMLHGRFA